MRVLHVLSAAAAALALSSCAGQRANDTQADLGQNLYDAQFRQINYQLSKAIDDPYSVPSFTFVSSNAVTSTDSLTATGTYTSAAAGLTRTLTGNVGGVSNQIAYTSSPVGDPDALRMVRDIYAYTVGETGWQKEFSGLKMKPPQRKWLVHSEGDDVAKKPGLFLIGRYGKHVLWTNSQEDYSNFVFSVLSALAPVPPSSDSGKSGGKGKGAAKPSGSRIFNAPKNTTLYDSNGNLITN